MNPSSTPKNDDFVREIARYHQEMIQASRRSAFREQDERLSEDPVSDAPVTNPTIPETEPTVTAEEANLTAEEPVPDRPDPPITLSAPPVPTEQPDAPADAPPSALPRDATGYLRIQTFTAR